MEVGPKLECALVRPAPVFVIDCKIIAELYAGEIQRIGAHWICSTNKTSKGTVPAAAFGMPAGAEVNEHPSPLGRMRT